MVMATCQCWCHSVETSRHYEVNEPLCCFSPTITPFLHPPNMCCASPQNRAKFLYDNGRNDITPFNPKNKTDTYFVASNRLFYGDNRFRSATSEAYNLPPNAHKFDIKLQNGHRHSTDECTSTASQMHPPSSQMHPHPHRHFTTRPPCVVRHAALPPLYWSALFHCHSLTLPRRLLVALRTAVLCVPQSTTTAT